jgi:hypothetical protein
LKMKEHGAVHLESYIQEKWKHMSHKDFSMKCTQIIHNSPKLETIQIWTD